MTRDIELLTRIRRQKPIILNITKYFPLELIVSGLRSIGALPITSNAEQEVEELLKLSSAVVISLGKLDDEFIQLCEKICQASNKLMKPIILDPIGAGASCYRTNTSLNLIKNHKISVLRGYPNEIAGLLNHQLIPIGTESKKNSLVYENAKHLSERYDMAVVVSGKINAVIDSHSIEHFNYDSALVQNVAGISSLLSSIIGAFHAIEKNRFIAASSALEFYAECVGVAKSKSAGPGSLKTNLIDELYLKSI